MEHNYGTVNWGDLFGDSLDFEEQVRRGEIVLDEEPRSSRERQSTDTSSEKENSGLISKTRKPGKGRGRGAVLPTAYHDEVGVGNPTQISPKRSNPVFAHQEIIHKSSSKAVLPDASKEAKHVHVVKQITKTSEQKPIVTPEAAQKTALTRERAFPQPYVAYGRGTVPNRVRGDSETSPGRKQTHRNNAGNDIAPPLKSEIESKCLKSRNVVLKKLSEVEAKDSKGADSDDKESLEEIELQPQRIEVKPVKAKEDDDVSKLKVEYGCIQLADIPGRVLVRGGEKHRSLKKIEMLRNFDILKRGISNCGIEDLNMLQKAVAPYVFSGSDCFILGGKSCGKTLSYLMPTIANCITEFEVQGCNSGKDSGSGPIAIIICKDFSSALKIEGHVNNLVTSANKYQIFGALICDDRKETKEKLEIGVDIMITTLDFACVMARRNYNTLVVDRLRTLVFEEIDILLRLSPNDVRLVREVTENFASKLSSKKPFQRIFCGREWTREIEDMYNSIQPISDPAIRSVPAILIQSPNQALKYSKIKLLFHHIPDGPVAKLRKLTELLQSKDLAVHRDVFIACSAPNVVLFVHEGLAKFKIDSACAETLTMDHHELGAIKRRWQDSPSKRRILVLHDKILRSLEVHNVTLLIHFDLPEKSPHVVAATGADRFSCMWGNFRDLSKEKRKPSLVQERKLLESHFLLSGEEPELYKLKVFGSKMECEMPESLDKLANELGKLHTDRKKVCPYMKLYGECVVSASESCPFRHYFHAEELEKVPVVPRNCELEVRITRCINPSQYIGQIIRLHEIEKGKRKPGISYANLLKKRTTQLTEYFEIEENMVPLECYAPGTLCAVEMPGGEGYARAVIDKVMTRTSLNLPNTIRVFCLDTGEHLQPLAEDLLVLSDEMKNAKNLSVEINLSNLQPPRGEIDYRPHHIQGARNLTQDKILVGRVRFAIGSEVWINPLIEMELDSVTKAASKKLSVRLEMMRCFFAENNENHMSNIFKLCKETGFVCPELEDEFELEAQLPQFFEVGDDINWSYLPVNANERDSSAFWPTFTRNPYNIFGIQDKFSEQLDDLEKEVHNYGQHMAEEVCKSYATKFAAMYAPDLMVAAFDSVDSLWRRALITESYEKGGQLMYDVYFVDVGELNSDFTSKDLLPIPTNLVRRLPCQAIALKLSHIRPTNSQESWSLDAINKTMSLTVDDTDDSVKMDVVALESIAHPTLPCRYYKAVILQPDGEDLGDNLVASNLAVHVENGENLSKSIRDKLLERLNREFEMHIQQDDVNSEEEGDGDGFDFDDLDRWDLGGVMENQGREILPKNGYKKPPGGLAQAELNAAVVPEANQVPRATESTSSPSSVPESTERSAISSPLPAVPLLSSLLHPTVIWKQTKLELTLSIQLPDIKKYKFEAVKTKVSFESLRPAGYGFDLELCGRVHDPEIVLFGLYMKVKLKKKVEWLWPKLLANDVKFPWVKPDMDAEDSDEENDQNWNCSVEKSSASRPNLLPFESSSESEDTDNEVDDVEKLELDL